MWCITAYPPDNGPLRVIPGSHRSDREVNEDLPFGSGMGPHPDEVRLIVPAGSLILFNSASLWHSGTLNYSPGLRLALTAYLCPPKPVGSQGGRAEGGGASLAWSSASWSSGLPRAARPPWRRSPLVAALARRFAVGPSASPW